MSVIIVSESMDPSIVREAFLAGASDVISGEVLEDPEAFGVAVNRVLTVSPLSDMGPELDRLVGFLDTLADAVSIQDRDLKVIYQNRSHIGLVGNHNGKYCYQAYAEGDEPCTDCPVLACFRDGQPHRLTKESPKGLVVDISASPLKDADGKVWSGMEVVRDVTERHRLEDALRNTAEGISAQTGEDFFHSLTEYLVNTLGMSTAFIGVTDENDPDISRTISFYHAGAHRNNFWYRKAGTPCGEVASKGLCVFSNGVQDSFPTIDMLKEIDARSYVGAPLLGSDKRPLGVLSVLDSKPLQNEGLAESLLMIFASRVSAELDRLKVENALRESGRRLMEMLENIELYAVMFDVGANVTFANSHLLKVTGRTSDEVVGRNWFELFLPEEHAAEQEIRFLSMLAAEDFMPHVENVVLTSEGESRDVSWSNTLMRDGSGVVTGMCCIGEDVTERKNTERERTELFHMMTHDIKGPLSIINGYSELLLSEDSEVSVSDSASEIRKASRRIFSLIEDMLTLSAMEAGTVIVREERVNMSELVEESLAAVRVSADELGVSIDAEIKEGEPLIVFGDRDQLRRAVENLLLNAVYYNKYQGTVSVRAGLTDGGGGIFLDVSDTGMGIPEPDLPHIFEKYYRSTITGKKHGTGLGLAIVKRAVEGTGGSVTVWNNSDEGATFRVELPLNGKGNGR